MKRLAVLFLLPLAASAASKEIVELQRDMAQLQDQIKTLQQTLTEKLTTLNVLTQQAADNANRASTSVATLQGGVGEITREQGRSVNSSIVGLNSKLDGISGDVQSLRDAMADLTSRMGKMEQRLTDISDRSRQLPAPGTGGAAPTGLPAPPPPTGAAPSGGPQSALTPATPPPGMKSSTLYDSAYRSMISGDYEGAQQGFTDYVRYYGNTEFAANAQYYLGEIAFRKKDYPAALSAFDLVLERYPENMKTPDAMLAKGRTLVVLGQRNDAAKEFQNLAKKYPNREPGQKARQELASLGLRPAASPAVPVSTPRRRR